MDGLAPAGPESFAAIATSNPNPEEVEVHVHTRSFWQGTGAGLSMVEDAGLRGRVGAQELPRHPSCHWSLRHALAMAAMAICVIGTLAVCKSKSQLAARDLMSREAMGEGGVLHAAQGWLGGQRGESVQSSTPAPVWEPEGRVALCLVGGARRFELTAPSLAEFLLPAYGARTDLFVHAPIDADAHGLSALQGTPNFVAARIFAPTPIREQGAPQTVLRASDSPGAIQGLLQYFRLVEGCLGLMDAYESERGFRYQWVLRTRLDTYWSAPPPPLATLDIRAYTIPIGSDYGGLNDRFGIGGREASQVALGRLSALPRLAAAGCRSMNSEISYKMQFQTLNISVARADIPMCVLSQRTYSWPPGPSTPPVLSLPPCGSGAALNGAKCRPCAPLLTGAAAHAALLALSSATSRPGVRGGAGLCRSDRGFQEGWERRFDEAAGPSAAAVRQHLSGRSLAACVAEVGALVASVRTWAGPSPEALCVLGALGPLGELKGTLWPVHVFRAMEGAKVHVQKGGELLVRGAVSISQGDLILLLTTGPGTQGLQEALQSPPRTCQTQLILPALNDQEREEIMEVFTRADLLPVACTSIDKDNKYRERCTFISIPRCLSFLAEERKATH